MILNRDDGIINPDSSQEQHYEQMGYSHCPGKKRNGPCPFYLSPQAVQAVTEQGGYFTCPVCLKSFNLVHSEPWVRPDYDYEYHGGIPSKSGLSVNDVGQIGEDLIKNLTLPKYGPFEWFHEGGSTGRSPLDAATKDWGVEIKTVLYDTMNHRFVPGGTRSRVLGRDYDERAAKNEAAAKAGKLGILGLLVILDMRRSVADIYAKEMPLAGWQTSQGRSMSGIAAFRSNTAEHLIMEVPFKNPYMDPNDPSPVSPFKQEDAIPF